MITVHSTRSARRVGATALAFVALVLGACATPPGPSEPGTRPLLCATGSYALGQLQPLAFSASGHRLLAGVPDDGEMDDGVMGDGETTEYRLVDTTTGASRTIDVPLLDGDGAEAHISSDGTAVLLGRYGEFPPGEHRWQAYDALSGTVSDALVSLGPDDEVLAVSDDLGHAIVKEWSVTDAPHRLVDVASGASHELGLQNSPGWTAMAYSPDLALRVEKSNSGGYIRSVRVVSTETGDVVRDLGLVRSRGAHSLWPRFVDATTLLFTDAEPSGAPAGGVPDDSAFLVDVTDGEVKRIDPGVAGARTSHATADGNRQLYYTGNYLELWLRVGDQHRLVSGMSFPTVNENLTVAAMWDETGATLHCL